jgi:hypothetical protein
MKHPKRCGAIASHRSPWGVKVWSAVALGEEELVNTALRRGLAENLMDPQGFVRITTHPKVFERPLPMPNLLCALIAGRYWGIMRQPFR